MIGLPVPGRRGQAGPVAAKLELRVRGPNVTPGYFKAPDLTREAFDGDGFYRTGDAEGCSIRSRRRKGLVFDGRLAEDFKLGTGTWVHVGGLRTTVLAACAPALQDLVVCGHDRDQIGILAWPNLERPAATWCPDRRPRCQSSPRSHPEVVAAVRSGRSSAQRGSRRALRRGSRGST